MKKRYQVTLTEETVKRFQALAEKLKMPKGIMSTVLDDALESVLDSMERFAAKGGKLTMADLFTAIGEQIDSLTEEVKQNAANAEQKAPAKKRSQKEPHGR